MIGTEWFISVTSVYIYDSGSTIPKICLIVICTPRRQLETIIESPVAFSFNTMRVDGAGRLRMSNR